VGILFLVLLQMWANMDTGLSLAVSSFIPIPFHHYQRINNPKWPYPSFSQFALLSYQHACLMRLLFFILSFCFLIFVLSEIIISDYLPPDVWPTREVNTKKSFFSGTTMVLIHSFQGASVTCVMFEGYQSRLW
jgi:hypothetical protein